jgi:hypothetical protein
MPLSPQAQERLAEFSVASGDFALFGIALNPVTGELATYSSHGLPCGAVLGFLQRAVEQMVNAAASGELEYIGGNDGMAQGSTPETEGGKIGLVH